jgi:hypothetical protein
VKRAVWLAVALLVVFFARASAAQDAEIDTLHKQAVEALKEGKHGDAIARFEALADRGVVDAHVSFDRALAYASRVRAGAEVAGDLGRAAHGLEEARALSDDERLEQEASRGLSVIRSEVARRAAHAGERVDMDQNLSLGRTLVQLVPENGWAVAALGASLLLAIALGLRLLAPPGRARVGATVAAAIAALFVVVLGALTHFARRDRLHLREGVVVVQGARPADARGLTLPDAQPLPEAARVELQEGDKPGWTRVRWGKTEGWVPASAVREITRRQ